MKFSLKAVPAVLLAVLISSRAFAALPSVTMIADKTNPVCVRMEKILDELNTNYAGKMYVGRIYLEDSPDIAVQYNITYVPTLIFGGRDGKIAAVELGYRSAEGIIRIFKRLGIAF